jgi:hypothetical protein
MNAATTEFRNFINAFPGHQERRIELMVEDAVKRVELETGTLTLASASDFLDAATEFGRCQQALDLGIYLLRRAKMESNCNKLRNFVNNAELFFTLASECDELSDAVCFYRNLGRIIRAVCIGNNTIRAQEYQQIAAAVTNCRGDYAIEAKYVKAYCLFLAWDADNTVGAASINQAESLFRDLVNNHRNVRALYYLAQIFRLYRHYIQSSMILYQRVIDAVDDCEGYSYFGRQSASAINLLNATNPPDQGNGSELNNVNYQLVQCPDNMITEGICQLDVILDEIAVDIKKRIKIFGLPKASVYPTDLDLTGSTLRTFCNTLGAGVPTGFDIEDYYQVKLQVVVADDNVGQAVKDYTVYDSDGNIITDDDGDPNDAYFTIDEISVSIPLRVCIRRDGYYPYHLDTIGGRNTSVYHTALLAPVVKYDPADTPGRIKSILLLPQSNKKYKIIVDPSLSLEPECGLRGDFDTSFNSLRDFTVNTASREILVLDGRLRRLAYYDLNGEPKNSYLELNQGNNTPLVMDDAEGITVDILNHIYITDRGNNRVVIFDPDGNQVCSFGNFGVNIASGCFVDGKFVGPAGIAIEKDDRGIAFENETMYYRPHILVSDFYGIHKFDIFGHYLGSPVNLPGDNRVSIYGFDKGDFWDFDVIGHGLNSEMYVVDRNDGTVYTLRASE